MAGPKGKGNSVCKDPESRDTRVCTSAVRRDMMFLGGGGG